MPGQQPRTRQSQGLVQPSSGAATETGPSQQGGTWLESFAMHP